MIGIDSYSSGLRVINIGLASKILYLLLAIVLFLGFSWSEYGLPEIEQVRQVVENYDYLVDGNICKHELLTKIMIGSTFVRDPTPKKRETYDIDFYYKLEDLLEKHFDWSVYLTGDRIVLWSEHWNSKIAVPYEYSDLSAVDGNPYLEWTYERKTNGRVYAIPHYTTIPHDLKLYWFVLLLAFMFFLICIASVILVSLFVYWPMIFWMRVYNRKKYARHEYNRFSEGSSSAEYLNRIPAAKGLLIIGWDDDRTDHFYNTSKE
ncbi:hypothetical protein ISR92_01300 [Patescibacteria group bacterium]|nr:hypothetical protein [Patescibacteria group bacterium]